MILLDTNYLIRSLVPASAEASAVLAWIRAGEELRSSAVSWYEFLCGPVDTEGIGIVHGLIDGRIIPFTADQASEAARLFNAAGRGRPLRVDALIAAAAIISNASLATDNQLGFSAFVPQGLKLLRQGSRS